MQLCEQPVHAKAEDDWFRRAAAWARRLPEAEFERARAGVRRQSVRRGVTVCAQHEVFDYWIGVIDGLLKLRTFTPEGKEICFAGVNTGGWFGEGSLLKREPRKYEVIALKDSKVALLDHRTFIWLFEHSLEFNHVLIAQMNERLAHFIGRVEHDRKLDTKARVARALATLLNPVYYPDADLQLELNQEEVGLLAGVSRPVANQALRELEQGGILRVTYGGILVLDVARLRAYGEWDT